MHFLSRSFMLSLTLCASLYGMDADKQPEAKPAPDSITTLIEQEKNESHQDQKERVYPEGDASRRDDPQEDMGAWYDNFTLKYYRSRYKGERFSPGGDLCWRDDLQNDMEAWWGKFDITIEYSWYGAWQRLGRAPFSSTDDEKKSPEKKQDEAQ
jgi:hypothetical protein